MNWHPIFQKEEPRIWNSIHAIAESLGSEMDTALLQPSDHAWIALFFHRLYLTGRASGDRDEQHLDQAIEAVAGSIPPYFFNGFTGIAWVTELLYPNTSDPEEDANKDIDTELISILRKEFWTSDYDLMMGLVGYGVYALSRLQQYSAVLCLERIIGHLESTARSEGNGVSWRTTAEMQYFGQISSEEHFNLGLAHGVPGVLSLLSHACLAGVCSQRARPLLRDGVRWLLTQRNPEGPFAFGHFALPSGPPPSAAPLLAWCYGDLGISSALWMASRALQDSDLGKYALDIARQAASRPIIPAVDLEVGLCHGAAGIGHMLNRLHHASGAADLNNLARTWLLHAAVLTEGYTRQGLMIHSSRNLPNGARQWVPDPGFLSGAAGVGLALLAAVSNQPPVWDQCLLLSGPYSGYPSDPRI